MLTFHYAETGQAAVDNLSQRLLQELQASKQVLWLLGGGSNIALSVEAMAAIPAELQPQLTIMMTDERYGSFDHPDSNDLQLRQAGFNPGGARYVPMLQTNNASLEDTVANYTNLMAQALPVTDVVIAQLGIGADGHIAGMLPHSPAVTNETLIAGYDAGQFTRLTMTAAALRQIHVAYVYAFGEAKREALANLKHQSLPLDVEPAQILKELPEAHLYSDQVSEQAEPDDTASSPEPLVRP